MADNVEVSNTGRDKEGSKRVSERFASASSRCRREWVDGAYIGLSNSGEAVYADGSGDSHVTSYGEHGIKGMSDNDEDTNLAAEAQERSALRTVREFLLAENGQLRREYEATRASTDVARLHSLTERLVQHNDKLTQFYDRLEAFHKRYGSLGK
jgi:hypothetical protein